MNAIENEEDQGAPRAHTSQTVATAFVEPPGPAPREWIGEILGAMGLGCLAAAGALVAQHFGFLDQVPRAGEILGKLSGAGATPALLGVGGAILTGLGFASNGRRRHSRSLIEAVGSVPDYGAWLQDLDESLQRLHVSLVTVESRMTEAVERTANELDARVREFAGNDARNHELGARMMRLEATMQQVAAAASRIDEQSRSRAGANELETLGAKLTALAERIEDLAAAGSTEAPTRVEPEPEPEPRSKITPLTSAAAVATAPPVVEVPLFEERPQLPPVDAPRAPMPHAAEAPEDLIDESSVDELSLFAAVEEPTTRKAPPSERASRNPYERGR